MNAYTTHQRAERNNYEFANNAPSVEFFTCCRTLLRYLPVLISCRKLAYCYSHVLMQGWAPFANLHLFANASILFANSNLYAAHWYMACYFMSLPHIDSVSITNKYPLPRTSSLLRNSYLLPRFANLKQIQRQKNIKIISCHKSKYSVDGAWFANSYLLPHTAAVFTLLLFAASWFIVSKFTLVDANCCIVYEFVLLPHAI